MSLHHCAEIHPQGRKDVIVHVTDLNDNAPEFNPSLMTVTLTEGNSTAGKYVVTVNATDKDGGNNRLITYSIIEGNLGDVFQIDGDTVRCIMRTMYEMHLIRECYN